jgi:hypothetical protein
MKSKKKKKKPSTFFSEASGEDVESCLCKMKRSRLSHSRIAACHENTSSHWHVRTCSAQPQKCRNRKQHKNQEEPHCKKKKLQKLRLVQSSRLGVQCIFRFSLLFGQGKMCSIVRKRQLVF